MIFTARESVAMDPKKPRAEAIAVKGNKAVAVGTGAEVAAAAGKDARLEFFLNDAALKATGIDKAVIDAMPKSARDQANWEKGRFYEQSAIALLTRIAPLITTPEETRHE